MDVIIQLANRLGVEVITEGIETKDQLDLSIDVAVIWYRLLFLCANEN